MKANFRDVFVLLKKLFDYPTPRYGDFDAWRHETYEALKAGRLNNLPLKIWWPKYTNGDFRLELCIGALLIQRVKWSQVKACIKNLDDFLSNIDKKFDIDGLLSIPPEKFQSLIRASRYHKVKTGCILKFCSFVKGQGTIDNLFRRAGAKSLGERLRNLKSGFGDETRDCILLYAANFPIFIADTYARKLLQILNLTSSDNYNICQEIFQEAIQRDFSEEQLKSILGEYTSEELHYILCNSPAQHSIALVLLYQQFHAGIVELGISKRWREFVQLLRRL